MLTFINTKGILHAIVQTKRKIMNNNAMTHYLKQHNILNNDQSLYIKHKKILNNNPEIIQKILDHTSFLKYSACIKTRLHCIINGITTQPTCGCCNNIVKMRLDGIYRFTFPTYCGSKCSSSISTVKEKRKQTKLTQLLDNPNLEAEIQAKRSQTNLEKYGFENAFQNKDIQDKQKQTKLKQHIDNPNLTAEIQQKTKQTNLKKFGTKNAMQNKDIQDKQKQTMIETYGVDNNFKRVGYMLECRLEKLGVEYPIQSAKIREKFTNTMMERHGVEHAHQSVYIRNKFTTTMTERYGTNHALQNKHVLEAKNTTCLDRFGVGNNRQQHMIHILPLITDKDWMIDQYITQKKPAGVIAQKLGCLDAHIVCNYLRDHNVEIRSIDTYSYKSCSWIESTMESENIHIQHAMNGGEFSIPTTRYHADGYCSETNTIYEFYGDYWHGNPKIYEPDFYNKNKDMTMGKAYQKTIERENKIKSLGYNLITIWESDYEQKI